MKHKIIRIAHKQGHFSINKTQEALENTSFISQLSTKLKKVVKICVECIVTDSKSGRKEEFLNPIGRGDRPLKTLHIDLVGPME